MAEVNRTRDEPGSSLLPWCAAILGWALVFLVAVVLGRMTRIDGTSLNLLWPAAGVSVVWFLLHRTSPVHWLDWVSLAAVIISVDVVTGASLSLALGLAAANLAQTALTTRLFVRWSPSLWVNGGDQQFARVAQFWQLTAAAAVGCAAGAAIGPAAIWWFGSGGWSPLLTLVWLLRNVVSMVLTGVVAVQLESLWAGHPSGPSLKRPPWVGRWAATKNWLQRRVSRHMLEGAGLCVATIAAYLSVFPLGRHLQVGFVLLTVTVWAGLRFSTTFVALHSFMVSVAAVLFTTAGDGPFAPIASDVDRALVTQVLIGMICVVGLCLSLGRCERAELIERLREAEHDARSQADVFATIVETMGAGLVVVSATGEPMLGNLAAHILTTPSTQIPPPRQYSGTPPPVIEALPYREALAGLVVDGMDVEMPAPPGTSGRVLHVCAAPLPARVGGGAVLVFTDVSGDRRAREDLTAFAGVVAHDLLTPLTAMSGWADLLSSLLSRAAPDPMVDMATESLTWIHDAANRASTMVGELLAYTTAGDAPLSTQDVDLADLVADLVAERTRTVSDSNPRFEIARLGHVLADPVLIRQLLANLIDNSIKYVAPGEVPQISISAVMAVPGWAQISVTDRGIGVPAGQHEAIFENFHRAHRESDYQGSGIGLATCRRIAERHGGIIRAEDNPGGGTRFIVTLPSTGEGLTEDVAAEAGSRSGQPDPDRRSRAFS